MLPSAPIGRVTCSSCATGLPSSCLAALLPNADRPYRCPGYPVVPALYVVLPAFILYYMVQSQRTEVFAGLGFIALGTLVFYACGLQRARPR